jgi:hypothetical protein
MVSREKGFFAASAMESLHNELKAAPSMDMLKYSFDPANLRCIKPRS